MSYYRLALFCASIALLLVASSEASPIVARGRLSSLRAARHHSDIEKRFLDIFNKRQISVDGASTSPEDGDVKFETIPGILQSDDSTIGRFHIFHGGYWGEISSSGFDNVSATVGCRSLDSGYNSGSKLGNSILFADDIQRQNAEKEFRKPYIVWLEGVQCFGDEEHLLDCAHLNWGDASQYRGFHSGFIKCTKEPQVGTAPHGTNVALRRPATQVAHSYYTHPQASVAVDGQQLDRSLDELYHSNQADFCTNLAYLQVSDDVIVAYWAVDLGQPTTVNQVIVSFKQMEGSSEVGNRKNTRQVNFKVGLTNDNPNLDPSAIDDIPLCGAYNGRTKGGAIIVFTCQPNAKQGRYIVVFNQKKLSTDIKHRSQFDYNLALCEVEAYTSGSVESDVTYCSTTMCSNSAICTDEINGYQCDCPPSFTGRNCQQAIKGEPKTVRLVARNESLGVGRLEAFKDGLWGTVNYKPWNGDQKFATVTCKMLGYSYGDIVPNENYSVTFGNGPISYCSLSCVGTETDIADCPEDNSYCDHYYDVSITCSN